MYWGALQTQPWLNKIVLWPEKNKLAQWGQTQRNRSKSGTQIQPLRGAAG